MTAAVGEATDAFSGAALSTAPGRSRASQVPTGPGTGGPGRDRIHPAARRPVTAARSRTASPAVSRD